MQPIIFKLPDLGEGVVEAEIVAWHVQPGEQVHVDQPLVEVMTDKATVTIPSGIDGRIISTRGNIGETVAVGSELVSFDVAQPAAVAVAEEPASPARPRPVVVAQTAPEELITVPMVPRAAAVAVEAAPLASPAVRRRAREMRVDLASVAGSGPNGRITHGDIDVFLRTEFAPTPVGPRPRLAPTPPRSISPGCAAASPRRWSSARPRFLTSLTSKKSTSPSSNRSASTSTAIAPTASRSSPTCLSSCSR